MWYVLFHSTILPGASILLVGLLYLVGLIGKGRLHTLRGSCVARYLDSYVESPTL